MDYDVTNQASQILIIMMLVCYLFRHIHRCMNPPPLPDPILLPEKYSSIAEPDTCTICIEDFEEGEQVIKLTPCTHMFHQKCINPWLEKSNECPNCKTEIKF